MSTATLKLSRPKDVVRVAFGKTLSYGVLVLWTALTVLPLFWMGYSAFKSNEEISRDVFTLPHDLFVNANDDFIVVAPQLNIVPDYNPREDTRERLIIESTEIAPTRRLMVQFLVKEDLPPEIANRQPGEHVNLSELPASMRRQISWATVWYNFRSAWVRGGLLAKFGNSLIYSCVATFLVVILGLSTGFALSKMGFRRLSGFVAALIGLGYLISIHSVIIPLFLSLSKLKLIDTRVGIILVYVAFGLPVSVLLSTQFIRELPDSLIESAHIDGAGILRTFFALIVPMSIPVAVTVAILSALGIWNEFILVLVLASSEDTKSLPVGVFSFASQTSIQAGWQMAALVITVLPAMIVYFIFNRQIAIGVVAGGVKG